MNINIKEFGTHKLCVWYLVNSQLYYIHDTSIITDEIFDNICKELLTRGDIPDKFKSFITKENLEAGSGYDIDWVSLPQYIKDIVHILYTGKDFRGEKINIKDWLI